MLAAQSPSMLIMLIRGGAIHETLPQALLAMVVMPGTRSANPEFPKPRKLLARPFYHKFHMEGPLRQEAGPQQPGGSCRSRA